MSTSDKKMALCMPSYKRFPDIMRQIYAMLHQSYQNCHLFVAIKGLSEFTFNHLIDQFQEFIDSGKLTLRYFPNKNQLSNFLDTIRDCDINDYDLFVKIDDDDFYFKDYLHDINEFHKTLPPGFSSYYNDIVLTLRQSGAYQILHPEFLSIFGPTIVMSKSVIDILQKNEFTPENFLSVNSYLEEYKTAAFGYTEDSLMHLIMKGEGCENRANYYKEKGYEPSFMGCRYNPSVLRGGDYVPASFSPKHVYMNPDPTLHERTYELEHYGWHDLLICVGDRGSRAEFDEKCTIVELTDERIVLKWDRWGVESFYKNLDGLYTFKESPEINELMK